MPKTKLTYSAPLTMLVSPDMKAHLSAIRYYRGSRSVGEATKDLIQDGIADFLAGLSPADRRRFDEILANVRISDAYRKLEGV